MFERFATSARRAVEDARYVAERRGDRRIGSDHLLIALLRDDGIAQIAGVDSAAAYEAAAELDRSALIAVGLTLGDHHTWGSAALGRHAPLTPGVKGVFASGLAKTTAEKARAITAQHLLLALLDLLEPEPAAILLEALSVDRARVRQRLTTAG